MAINLFLLHLAKVCTGFVVCTGVTFSFFFAPVEALEQLLQDSWPFKLHKTLQSAVLTNISTLKGGPSSEYKSDALGTECLVMAEIRSTGSAACGKASGKPGQTGNDWTAVHKVEIVT